MKGYLVASPAGLFLLEKTGKIVEKALFPKNPKDAAASFDEVKKGLLPKEHSGFAERLSQLEIEELIVDSEPLAKIARSIGISQVILGETDNTVNRLRNRLPSILVRLRLVESKDEYERFVRDVSLELAKAAITKATTKRDLYAIQTIRYIEDLDKTANLLAGRIREWYGLHFPELDRLVEKHDTYIRLIQNIGTRDGYSYDALVKLGLPQSRAEVIAEAAKRSAGAELPGPDLEWLQEVCSTTLQLYKLRETGEKYTDRIMAEVAPNMTTVLGSILSAKLVSIAGSLDKVAKMPASTLQVLGAEKALFRTLTTGAPPPKHGVIFQYGPIHQSPRWLRGKISRAVAGKLAIAARMDAFGGANEGEKLREALDAKIRELKDRYQGQPPKKKYRGSDRQTPREVPRDLLDTTRGRKETRHPQPGPRGQRLRRDLIQD